MEEGSESASDGISGWACKKDFSRWELWGVGSDTRAHAHTHRKIDTTDSESRGGIELKV